MKLNDAQKQAYMTNSQHVLVLAGAGTGKTHTMINRIHRIVSEGVQPRNILALTFTNAAAFEMRERYKKLSESSDCPAFQTFHAFCYSLISENYRALNEIGYANVPNIVEDVVIKNIKTKVKQELSIGLSKGKLEGDGSNLTIKEKLTYDTYHRALSRQLRKSNVITFDMLIKRVCNLFTTNHECIQRYIKLYQYIFIDEFQDTDPLQWEFAQCFKDSDIFIIGDALQAIYGFRGADSTIIKRIADDADWEVIKLYENYRSTIPIIEYANRISEKNNDAHRVELKAFREGLGVEEIVDFRSDSMCPYHTKTLSSVKDFCEVNFGTVAVLARTNREVSEIRSYLTSQDIECSSNDDFSDSTDILKSIIDAEYFFNWVMASMNREDNLAVNRILTINEVKSPVVQDILDISICPQVVRIKAKRVQDVMDILSADDFAFTRCEDVLKYLNIKGVTVLPDGDTVEELAQYLISEIENVEQKTIYVGTIHSSKGLEYDNVCVLGVDGPSFNLRTEEDNNLYYVAVTRAKTKLLVVHGINSL